MFLLFKNAINVYYKKSLYFIVVKNNVHNMSSVHGSSVLALIAFVLSCLYFSPQITNDTLGLFKCMFIRF